MGVYADCAYEHANFLANRIRVYALFIRINLFKKIWSDLIDFSKRLALGNFLQPNYRTCIVGICVQNFLNSAVKPR